MSDTEALLISVEEAILAAIQPEIAAAARDKHFVGRTVGGQPHPMADQFFISVHDATAENQAVPGADYQDVYHACQVTFSQRVGDTAEDRIGHVLLPVLRSRIGVVTSYFMNHRYPIMAAINGRLDLTSTNGFIEPLLVITPQAAITRRRGEWFHARDKNRTKASDGVTAVIRLGQARRMQACGSIN